MLSIIVPIYNVEQYLHKCIDSLLQQDIAPTDYEILLIDDGSTDNSAQIADYYAEQHENIHVVHQNNAGLSDARNVGIDKAKGDFVMFVDSDDFLEPCVLGTLIKKMKDDNLDILRFNYQNVNENYEPYKPNKTYKPFVDFRDGVCDGQTFLNQRLGGACYACQFILKNKFTHTTRFMPGRYYEDMLWTPEVLLHAQRVTSVDTIVYNYFTRADSITKSPNPSKVRKRIEDSMFVVETYLQMKRDVTDSRWFDSAIAQKVVNVLQTVATNFPTELDSYLSRIKALNVFPLHDYHATKFFRRKLFLINLSPQLFCYLMRAETWLRHFSGSK